MSINLKQITIDYRVFYFFAIMMISLMVTVITLTVLLYNTIQLCEDLKAQIMELTYQIQVYSQNELKNTETIRILSDKLETISSSIPITKDINSLVGEKNLPSKYQNMNVSKTIIKYLYYLTLTIILVTVASYSIHYLVTGSTDTFPFKVFEYADKGFHLVDDTLKEALRMTFGHYTTQQHFDAATGYTINIKHISADEVEIFFSKEGLENMSLKDLIHMIKVEGYQWGTRAERHYRQSLATSMDEMRMNEAKFSDDDPAVAALEALSKRFFNYVPEEAAANTATAITENSTALINTTTATANLDPNVVSQLLNFL